MNISSLQVFKVSLDGLEQHDLVKYISDYDKDIGI